MKDRMMFFGLLREGIRARKLGSRNLEFADSWTKKGNHSCELSEVNCIIAKGCHLVYEFSLIHGEEKAHFPGVRSDHALQHSRREEGHPLAAEPKSEAA